MAFLLGEGEMKTSDLVCYIWKAELCDKSMTYLL